MKRDLRGLAIDAKILQCVRSRVGEFVGVYEIARFIGLSRNCVYEHCVGLAKMYPSYFKIQNVDYRNTGAYVVALDPSCENLLSWGHFDESSLIEVFNGYIGKYAVYKQLRLPSF